LAALPALRRGMGAARRARLTLTAVLGLGLFLEIFWWTRPLVYYGVKATDPRRLLAAGAMALFALLCAWFAGPLLLRLRARVGHAGSLLLGLGWLCGGLFILFSASGDEQRGRLAETNRDLPNVVVFVVDALRDDVLEPYGSREVETPHLARLAASGVTFENALVQAPFTWSSFGSILTGKYPRRHGLVKMAPGVRMVPNVTLAQHLKSAARSDGAGSLSDQDYLCAAFMTGTVTRGSGLMRGFDTYFEALMGHELVDVHSSWSRFRSDLLLFLVKNKLSQRFDPTLVTSTAVKWIGENAQRRFFAFVHLYSTHTPYDPLPRFRDKYLDPAYDGPIEAFHAEHRYAIDAGKYDLTVPDRARIRDLYEAGTDQADAMIGRVLAELERLELTDNTLVVVTSDHGEELGEHNLWEHNFMYQTNLRVPLVMAWPGHLPAGRRVTPLVESVDLVPTLCEVMGLAGPVDEESGERGLVDGVSLLPLVRGEAQAAKEFSFAENGRYISIQDATRKLIVTRAAVTAEGFEAARTGAAEPARFFDLVNDPAEQHNLFPAQAEKAQELRLAIEEWSASLPIALHDFVESHRDREARELFGGLGYVGGVGDEEDEVSGPAKAGADDGEDKGMSPGPAAGDGPVPADGEAPPTDEGGG
ncbi:MAG: sulfatase, partial [Planctomycetota bacterium]|nr:sulfatase [Planctomycetota bacterium]